MHHVTATASIVKMGSLCVVHVLKTARSGGAAECIESQKLVHGSTAYSHWFKDMRSELSELPQSLS